MPRLATPFVLLGLHIVMEAPVWHLIARVSAVGGSTGWHRYHLIDAAIRNFGEWAILGVSGTAHWGWGLGDVTNQYVLEGIRGGAVTLAIFVCLLVFAFRYVGQGLRRYPARSGDFWIVWAVGVSLFAHMLSFMAVSYFGQTTMVWLLSLALSVAIVDVYGARGSVEEPAGVGRVPSEGLVRSPLVGGAEGLIHRGRRVVSKPLIATISDDSREETPEERGAEP